MDRHPELWRCVQQNEVEQSTYNFEHSDADFLFTAFAAHEKQAKYLMEQQLALPAYEQVLKCAHSFNLLDARGAISVTERAAHRRIRNLARAARATTKAASACGFHGPREWVAQMAKKSGLMPGLRNGFVTKERHDRFQRLI